MSFEFLAQNYTPTIGPLNDRVSTSALVAISVAPAALVPSPLETAQLPRLDPPARVACAEALDLLRKKVMLSPHDIAHLLELSNSSKSGSEVDCDFERQIFIDSSHQVTRAAERLHELTVEKRFRPGPVVDSLGLVQAGMATNLGSIVSCLRRLGIVAVGVIAPQDWDARRFVWRLYYQD